MDIAERIQSLRKQKGYSQEELAEKIGVSRQAVSKWESRQSTPDIDKIIALSDLFNISTDYILKGEETHTVPGENSIRPLFAGFAVVFGAVAGIWSFTANRFNYNECILIMLAGGTAGLGVALCVKTILANIKR